jgi:type I restriction enzyme S subunit
VELRPGYKQTEVGVIPVDWDVRPLLTTVRIANGQVSPLIEPYKSMVLIAPDHIEGSTGRLLVMKTAAEQRAISGKYVFDEGDIVYSKIRPYLRKAILADFTGLCSADMYPLRTTADVSSGFILAVLLGHHFSTYAESVSVRSGMPKINRSELAGYSLALPRLPEQHAIAAALNDVDALLEELTRLIAKKRDLKQAAMQQLLTGQTRLPGFHGEWTVKSLATLCSMKSGEGITGESIDQFSQYPCYGGNGLRGFASRYTHHGRYALIGRQGALCGNVYGVEGQFFASEHAIVVTASASADIGWLTHVLGMMNLNQYSESSAQPGLSVARILNLEVAAPTTKAEQAAIAAVLSDIDAELSALEARLDKTRVLKQAMMQELLTGRTRLVVPAFAESRKESEQTSGRQANVHFKRSVLAAEIIDRLHDEPTFGHVKFEKMIFLVEHLCNVDTGSTYHRDAAGPYDNRAMRSIDSQLRKQKWFDAQKIEGRYRYQPMANRGKHKEYFERYFGGISAAFGILIDTFRSFNSERCEIVATLFAAWNDLLQQNGLLSDAAIVNEVLNNWHESKKRIPEDRWRKALSWMRDHGFVPHNATGAV